MPNTNVSLVAPSVRSPTEMPSRPRLSVIHNGRTTIPRVDQRITRAANVSAPIAPQRSANVQQPAAGTITTEVRSETVLNMGNGLIVCGVKLPNSDGFNAPIRQAYVKAVLLAVSTASSDYWRQSLDSRALCMRYGGNGAVGGAIACRVSRDGLKEVLNSDAVIELTGNSLSNYTTPLSDTPPNPRRPHSFCSAAVRAALLHRPGFLNETAASRNATIARDEIELSESVNKWIDEHPHELQEVKRHIYLGLAAT